MISVCSIDVNAHVKARNQEQCGVYFEAPLAEALGNYPRNGANGGKQRHRYRKKNLMMAVDGTRIGKNSNTLWGRFFR